MLGYPFLLVKVENDKRVVEEGLRKFYGRSIGFGELLVETLTKLDRYHDPRAESSFDVENWFLEDFWSRRGWPLTTLVRELRGMGFRVLPWSEEARKLFLAYAGIGVTTGSEPVAVLLAEPRRPRPPSIPPTPPDSDTHTSVPSFEGRQRGASSPSELSRLRIAGEH